MGSPGSSERESIVAYIERLPMPVLVLNSGCDVVLMNRVARRTFGCKKGKCYKITHGIDRPCWKEFGEVGCPIKNLMSGKEPYAFHEHRDGSFHILVGSLLGDDLFMELCLDGYVSDIIRELRFFADTDSLTGVYNRRKIEEVLRSELVRVRRYGTPLSIMLIDIDNFKCVNDVCGHMKGDKVLQKVARTIESEIRSTDYLGKLGGDEFIVVLPQTETELAGKVAERIKRSIERKDFEGIKVTVSIGVTGYLEGDDYISLIERADRAMYSAKRKGKNRVEVL